MNALDGSLVDRVAIVTGSSSGIGAATAPLHRSATPEDCAEAVVSIIRNTYMTGHVVVVDGGTMLMI